MNVKTIHLVIFATLINFYLADYCTQTNPCGPVNPCYWVPEWTSYLCDCGNGKLNINSTCNPAINSDCVSNVCLNGGACKVTGINSFNCICSSNYTGKFCENKIIYANPCATSNLCLNQGTCFPLNENFYCQCATGYYGTRCENKIIRCPNGCVNGNCITKDNVSTCECNFGWTGISCNTSLIGTCDLNKNICLNGLCLNIYNGIIPVGYKCNCFLGYTGAQCETQINTLQKCKDVSCYYGICFDQPSGFQCKCFYNWNGTYCNEKINKNVNCDSLYLPCYNGGTCVSDSIGASCKCSNLFKGERCELSNVGASCSTNVCKNGGSCYISGTLITCVCASRYTGQYCETVI